KLRLYCFFFSSRRRHTRFDCDWSSDVCSSDLRRARMNSGARGDTELTPVRIEERGALAVIRINRPEQRNSLSVATLSELEQAFSNLSARDRISAVIFTGTDDVFASGADIRELRALTPDSAREYALRGQRFFRRIADARQ